jgi:galactose mutarotase-like enzyme
MISLENKHLKASFAAKGAELQSLINKNNNLNYLWSGDPAYWGKFSPVLFPIVGALKNNTYYFEGQSYQLSRHGFARDYEFEAFKLSDTEVVFRLMHNEETLRHYPFQFILQLRYRLQDSLLSCTYEVTNPSADRSILFSIGAHPAFAVPLTNDTQYKDYFLEFNKDHNITYHKISKDLIINDTADIQLQHNRLSLQHKLFYEDALVFKTLKSDCISLRNDKNEHGLHFKFKDFPFFGIWAAKDANFICLEPWCGIADGIDHQQDLRKKEGIVELEALKSWNRSWEIDCF